MAQAVKSRVTRRQQASVPPSQLMGCGVDLVELDRFQRAVKRGGQAFLERIFTPTEQRYAHSHQNAIPHLAARFAAKEAVVKAIAQVDPGQPLSLKRIEIRTDELGRPSVTLRGVAGDAYAIHVSLSHTERLAMACAIAVHQ